MLFLTNDYEKIEFVWIQYRDLVIFVLYYSQTGVLIDFSEPHRFHPHGLGCFVLRSRFHDAFFTVNAPASPYSV
jgi:hypothetical protein